MDTGSWTEVLSGLVGFFVTFNCEVSRKIPAPKDEIEGVDTFEVILAIAIAQRWGIGV